MENPAALADAICLLSKNRDLSRDLGCNGRDYIVRNFSRSSTAAKYIHELERLLDQDKPASNLAA